MRQQPGRQLRPVMRRLPVHPARWLRAHRTLLVAALAGIAIVATGCSVPNPGPANKVPANYVSLVGVTIPDIQYGNDPAQLLNLYLPAPGQRPAPVLVYAHSGGFVAGDRTGVAEGIQREVLRGYAVASVEYHLSPQAVFPVALQDMKTAVRWAKVHGRRVRPAYRRGVHGRLQRRREPRGDGGAHARSVRADGPPCGSGGGRLERPWCHHAVRLPGPHRHQPGGWGRGSSPTYIGSWDPNAMAVASPINYVTPSAPPMYIANGAQDGLVRSTQNGLAMAVRYLRAGRVKVGFYDYVDNQGHNVDVDGMNTTVLDFWLDAVRDGRLA